MSLKPPANYGTATAAADEDLAFTSPAKPQPPAYFPQPPYRPTTTSSLLQYPTRRPWPELFSLSAVSVPSSYSDAMARIRRNISYFRVNYAMAALLIVFLSLLWHPISMIVFLAALLAWLALYFLRRPDPIVLFNRALDDRVLVPALGLLTVVALVLTGVGLNVLVALIVAVALIGLHAAFRFTDDLYLDDGTAAENGLVSVVANSNQPLRPAHHQYTRIGSD